MVDHLEGDLMGSDLMGSDLDLTAGDAEALRAQAAAYRAAAGSGTDAMWRAETLARATALEAVAAGVIASALPLARGNGGEVVLRTGEDDPWPRLEISRATRDTPDLLDAEASVKRLELARNADALALAIDAAEGSGAVTPAEQMLAHQMAAAHALGMRLAAKADSFLARRFIPYQSSLPAAEQEVKREQIASIEASRMAGAAARMFEATARAAVALDWLRNGSRQTVIVQYVEVKDGGQAVVGGTVEVAPSRRRPGGAAE